MSHFEYVAVMISIIMGLGIIRLLSSLEAVFSQQRYWPHALWVLTMFWAHVQNWWGLWELNGLSFTVVIYSMTIVYASLMYLCAVALTNKTREEMSWKEYFFSQRRWFFGVFSITTFFAIFSTRIVLDAPLLHPYRIVQFTILAASIVGFFSAKEAVHKTVVIVVFLMFVFGVSLFRYLPNLYTNL